MEKVKNIDYDNLDKSADLLKSIGHPLRIAIIDLLRRNESLSVTEIYSCLGIRQSTISHHLTILKQKDVLGSERNGRQIKYFLNIETLNNIVACLNKRNA